MSQYLLVDYFSHLAPLHSTEATSLLPTPHDWQSTYHGYNSSSKLHNFAHSSRWALDAYQLVPALFGLAVALVVVRQIPSASRTSPSKAWSWARFQALCLIPCLIITTAASFAFPSHDSNLAGHGSIQYIAPTLAELSLCLILAERILQHRRNIVVQSGLVVYWLATAVPFVVQVQSCTFKKTNAATVISFVGLGCSVWMALVEGCNAPNKNQGRTILHPLENATVFSVLAFSWMGPLVSRAYKVTLALDDLFDLKAEDRSAVSGHRLMYLFELEIVSKARPSLYKVLLRTFWWPYSIAGAFKLISDLATFGQPLLLRELILFVGNYEAEPDQSFNHGIVICVVLFLTSLAQVFCKYQYIQRSKGVGMHVMSSLSIAVYNKAMKLTNEERAFFSTGNIVNLISVDLDRLSDLFAEGHMLWSAPLQIVIGLLLLYQLVGVCVFVGILVILMLLPIMGLTAKCEKRLQAQQMQAKDSRLRLISAALTSIKNIKLYNWSSVFLSKITAIREQELYFLMRLGIISSINNVLLTLAPFLISCVVFISLATISPQSLTTSVVFPALVLFNTLQFPLTRLPAIVTRAIGGALAIKRVKNFLLAAELPPECQGHCGEPGKDEVIIRMNEAHYAWEKGGHKVALRVERFCARKGKLVCILGRVGAGKSTMLNALLGNLHLRRGHMSVKGRPVYVPQQAWILGTTIRENILFGEQWDADRYNETLQACALTDDIRALPRGDVTHVGDGAVPLSGGQKMRVALARAVYARADVCLIDDCLAAVDRQVAQSLIDNVLGPYGLLRNRTRVIATNYGAILPHADLILLLDGGTIVEAGTHEEIFQRNGAASRFLDAVSIEADIARSGSKCLKGTNYSREPLGQDKFLDLSQSTQTHISKKIIAAGNQLDAIPGTAPDEENSPKGVQDKRTEVTAEGHVRWKVYKEYVKLAYMPALISAITFVTLGQAANIGTAIWLRNWCAHNDSGHGSSSLQTYLGIYVGLGVVSGLFFMGHNLVTAAFCSIRVSKKLHQLTASSIFAAPMRFFDVTPSGRILNRFSADFRRVDEVLSETFSFGLKFFTKTVFLIIVICVGTPLFLVLVFPLAVFYVRLQKRYLRTSRALTRLHHVTWSSVMSLCQDTLAGVDTIRAFGQQQNFATKYEATMDNHLKSRFLYTSMFSWLGIRLESIGSIIILITAALSLLSVSTGSGLSPSTCGLVMSSALQITVLFNLLVWNAGLIETGAVSIERILEYSQLTSEDSPTSGIHNPPASWPLSGRIAFKNYSARYSPELSRVIANANLEVESGERIGVVGRTGAGKSSLILALFRIIEAETGCIEIDGINTNQIKLSTLRNCLAVIPQDPLLFEGTIRENLDPNEEYDDTDLWTALDHAGLKDKVSEWDEQLDTHIIAGGLNLSHGYRQLISLARVFLSPAKIVLLDEATASVDTQTDAMIQSILRGPRFAGRTLITIAHRLDTVMDYDRILVMDHGSVAEFDRPAELLKQRGVLWRLVHDSKETSNRDRS